MSTIAERRNSASAPGNYSAADRRLDEAVEQAVAAGPSVPRFVPVKPQPPRPEVRRVGEINLGRHANATLWDGEIGYSLDVQISSDYARDVSEGEALIRSLADVIGRMQAALPVLRAVAAAESEAAHG